MTYRILCAGAIAATLAGIGNAAAQTVYIESYAPAAVYVEPAPTYVGPAPAYVAPVAPAEGYVVERRVVPAYPAVTYDPRIVASQFGPRAAAPSVQRRVVRTIEPGSVTYVTETDGSTGSCGYDSFGRLICD